MFLLWGNYRESPNTRFTSSTTSNIFISVSIFISAASSCEFVGSNWSKIIFTNSTISKILIWLSKFKSPWEGSYPMISSLKSSTAASTKEPPEPLSPS